MSDATLDTTAASADWSPGSLIQELDGLVEAALMMQGSALLVTAQPALAATWEVEDAAQAQVVSRAREAQLVARQHGDYCLSVIYPRVVSVVSEVRGATNLLETVSAQLSGGQTVGTGEVETVVRDALNDCQVAVEDLGDDVQRGVAKVAGPLGSALTAVRTMVHEADDEGWLDRTSGALDAVRADIQKDLAGIYAWRNTFGASVSGIVESLIKLVPGAPEDKKADEEKTDAKNKDSKSGDPKKKAETQSDHAEDKKKPSEEKSVDQEVGAGRTPVLASGAAAPAEKKDDSGGFDVKKLNFIGDQVADLGERMGALHEHYDRLAGLYLDLAQENGALAVGRALIDQVQILVDATSRTASGAEELGATWRTILGAETGSAASIVEHQLEWRRVQRRLTQLERALTG